MPTSNFTHIVTKAGTFLLILLAVAWIVIASPEIFRSPGSPLIAAFVVALGAAWMCVVPGAYFFALRSLQKNPLDNSDPVARTAFTSGFIVSYGVLASCVGMGAITAFHLGGMYESSLFWVFAPFIAGKASLISFLVGALIRTVISRRTRV